MNQKQFEISNIPPSIKALLSFLKWINVGKLLDEAMLVGLIEYHIKSNQLEKIQNEIFLANPNNQSMQKINTLLNNSKNKPNRFLSFIEQIKIQDQYGQWFKETIKSYFRYNYKNSPSEQYNFLSEKFQVQFEIYEQSFQSKFYGIATNGGINKIVLYKYEDYFYLILKDIEKLCCKCKTKQNLITLECQHFICYDCLSKKFEQQPSLLLFECYQCKQYIKREFYQNIKQQKIYCHQNSEELNKQQQINSQQIDTFKKSSNKEQNEQQQNQLIQINEQDNKQDILKSNIENNSKNIQMEIENPIQEIIQKCAKCKKQLRQEQLILTPCQHYYCKECSLEYCENRHKFPCLECGFYIQTDIIKLSLFKPNKDKDQNCCKCKQLFNETLLFYNKCFHYICASCLEALAQKQTYLRCPLCNRQINLNDADNFLDAILTLKIQQTEEEQRLIQQEQNNELNSQIYLKQQQNSKIQVQKNNQREINDNSQNSQISQSEVNNLDNNLIQLEVPQYCSFCYSPFTEYNSHQYLAYCQDARHFIGVCCIIFPLDCPQCQIKSLIIEKESFKFHLPQNNSYDHNNFQQY